MNWTRPRVMNLQTLRRLQHNGKGACRNCGEPFRVYGKYVAKRQSGKNTPPLCVPCAERLNVI
jgi:hypothetical protein